MQKEENNQSLDEMLGPNEETAVTINVDDLPAETAIYQPPVDWNTVELPNLHEGTVSNIELANKYWQPEDGEVKLVFFDSIGSIKVPSMDGSDELKDLEVVFLVEQLEDGTLQGIMNGAKALVNMIRQKNLKRSDGLRVTYLGKEKGKSGYKYDNFSIRGIT